MVNDNCRHGLLGAFGIAAHQHFEQIGEPEGFRFLFLGLTPLDRAADACGDGFPHASGFHEVVNEAVLFGRGREHEAVLLQLAHGLSGQLAARGDLRHGGIVHGGEEIFVMLAQMH